MTNFSWTGITDLGKKMSGTMPAKNKMDVISALQHNKIAALTIKKIWFSQDFFQHKKLNTKQRIDFIRQLQLLLQAGISLSDALSLIAANSHQKIIQTISNTLTEKMKSGLSFSLALAYFSNDFDSTFCKIIAAGEYTGKLDAIFSSWIENQENMLVIKNKLSRALFYPVIVLVTAIIITIGLLLWVIPEFNTLYQNFGAQLPVMTRTLIAISHHLSQHGISYLLFIIVFFLLIKKIMSKNKNTKKWIATLLFRIPLIQSLIITKQIAQWSQLIAVTLSSGIPLIDALAIANQAISQPVLQTQLQQARQSVIEGKSLHRALDDCRYFPAHANMMIAIGEKADALSLMMQKIGFSYQQQLANTLDRLSKMVEPVMMMAVASLISGLVIAMYLPIFKMGNII